MQRTQYSSRERARIERVAEDARNAQMKIRNDVLDVRNEVKSIVEHSFGAKNEIPTIKTLVANLEHHIEVLQHNISDMNSHTRELVTRNQDELTKKILNVNSNIQTSDWKRSQLQQEIVTIKEKLNVHSVELNTEQFDIRVDALQDMLEQLNITMVRNILFSFVIF